MLVVLVSDAMNQQSESNVGLARCWEAALAEMESLSDVPEERRNVAVNVWAKEVPGTVAQELDFVDAW
jgi:hypothetical protein